MSTTAKVGLFKTLWHKFPEIVGSSFMGLIGIGLGVTAVVKYYANDMDIKKYKPEYTVYRDDDPRAEVYINKYGTS